MAIPTTVANGMVSGVVGEISHDGPTRVHTKVLDSTDAADNVFGRAFTIKDSDTETVQAGGAGVFSGIMVNPKAYAIELDGTAPNGTVSEFLDMGEVYAAVTGAEAAAEGDPVYFVPATGALTVADVDNTLVPNCTIRRHKPSAETPSLAVIRLTN